MKTEHTVLLIILGIALIVMVWGGYELYQSTKTT